MRKTLLLLFAVALLGAGILAYAVAEARRDPVVRRASVSLVGWPKGTAPVRAILISDIHIGTIAMDAGRLTRIVAQINALKPDIVLIAGDMIFGHDPHGAATLGGPMVAPLSRLAVPLGVVAVLGNHDNWTGAAVVRDQFRRAGITVIENAAIVRGPLAIGGVGDDFSGHANPAATLAAQEQLLGGRVLVSHSPDIAPGLPTGSVLLAGHTHCGQVVLPFYGPVSDVSRFGARYRCGIVREPGRVVVVTAGLGTSGPPVRLGAPPDLWLLTLGP